MRLIFGKARSGKTAAIIREIRESVSSGQGHSLLIVPEQYSHEAERELCAVCGDRLSLHAEVMSFSGLARWSMSRRGGAAVKHMDEAGRLLCMALAVQNLETSLDSFRSAAHQTELQALMVREVQRLRSAGGRTRGQAGKKTGGICPDYRGVRCRHRTGRGKLRRAPLPACKTGGQRRAPRV